MNKFCSFALLLVAATAASAATAAPAPDPYRIFANARTYWLMQHYPQKLEFTVAVAVLEGGRQRVEHYNAA